jgi:tetratricopeptide (TPR) repeat protein
MEGLPVTEGGQPSRWLDAEGMRASLSAVRVALAEARARNRRETWKARLLVGTALVTFVLGVVATRPRAAHQTRPRGPEPVATVVVAARPAPLPAAPERASPIGAGRAALAETSASATPGTSIADDAANAGAVAECEMLCKHHRWRQAAEPCAVAVKARPDDATVVLGLAQSAHARNRLTEAGEWAQRAVALDPNLAEAFIIQAHAEAHAGDPAAAARDFRRYLSLAPRGWHAREARAALRAHEAR